MVLLLCLWAGHQGQTRHPASVTMRHAVRTPSMQPSNTVSLDIMSRICDITVTQYSPLHLLLHHLVLLGAAELVLGSPAAEDVLVVVAGGAVEARVPFAGGVDISRAVLRAQDG